MSTDKISDSFDPKKGRHSLYHRPPPPPPKITQKKVFHKLFDLSYKYIDVTGDD